MGFTGVLAVVVGGVVEVNAVNGVDGVNQIVGTVDVVLVRF